MEEKIIRGNRLITEFMEIGETGAVFNPYGNSIKTWYVKYLNYITPTFKIPGKAIEYFLKESRFNSSWDWLMPVVSKIVNQKNYLTVDTGSILETWEHVVKYISNLKENSNEEIKDMAIKTKKGPRDGRERPVFIRYNNKQTLALSDGKGDIYLPKSDLLYDAVEEKTRNLEPLNPELFEYIRGLTGFDF